MNASISPRLVSTVAAFAVCRAISTDNLHFPVRVLVILAARGYSRSATDRGHGSVYRLGDVPSQFFRDPIQTRRARRGSQIRNAGSTPRARGRAGGTARV